LIAARFGIQRYSLSNALTVQGKLSLKISDQKNEKSHLGVGRKLPQKCHVLFERDLRVLFFTLKSSDKNLF
jgi:hypothetical protein